MDWEKVAVLLDVVHKTASAGPAYVWFGDQARVELQKIKDAAEPKPVIPNQPPADDVNEDAPFTARLK